MPAATFRAWLPGRGIVDDVRGRLPHYRDDWLQGCNWGVKVFAPATYIFFASALPALAFGQQLAVDTAGTLTVVHVLISTALAGLVQSIIGGQPLLIIGVAEPIVLIYGFLYSYCSSNADLGSVLFLPWCAWVCIWTAVMCLLLALLNACDGINIFTRFSGELFGALIAILFLQVGIKGLVHEFQPAAAAQTGSSSPTASSSSSSNLLLINGLWGLLLAFGLLLTSLKILTARRWLLGRSWLRGLLADYGVPLLVVVWTAASFAVRPEHDVPRRVQTPNTWEVYDNWSVARRLSDVPGPYIAAALLPAIVITILFYFDHNVSSQMAQQPEFDLKKPAAYHYDFLLLAALTLICGLLGLPPVNGVLPQAPMHSRSLAHIRKHKKCKQQQQQQQSVSLEMLQQPPAARSSAAATPSNAGTDTGSNAADIVTNAAAAAAAAAADSSQMLSMHHPARHHTAVQITTTSLEIPDSPGSTHWQQQQQQQQGLGGTAELRHRHHSPHSHHQQQQQQVNDTQQQQQRKGTKPLKEVDSEVQLNMLPDSAADGRVLLADNTGSSSSEQQQQHTGYYLQLEVREQRVTNLLQSLLVCLCLGITPAIKLIPTAVLWGYFIFMAADSLTGSQLWDRTLLLITDPKKRITVMQQEHAAYLQLVPYRVIVLFTLLQLSYLLAVWALTTWAGVAAVTFPLPIMALVPVRQYLLPLLFKQQHLAQLDAASYEAAAAVTDPVQAQQELVAVGAIAAAPEDQLPTAANGAAAAAAAGGDDLSPTAAAAAAVAEDEGELLDHEFVRYQLKHHLDTTELNRHRQAW